MTLRCRILQADLSLQQPIAFPISNRTWIMNDIVMTDNVAGDNPELRMDFLMSGNKALFMPGLIFPQTIEFFPSGNLRLDTALLNLSQPALAPSGVTKNNFRELAFEELLGTYECRVANQLGGDSATSVVTRCESKTV